MRSIKFGSLDEMRTEGKVGMIRVDKDNTYIYVHETEEARVLAWCCRHFAIHDTTCGTGRSPEACQAMGPCTQGSDDEKHQGPPKTPGYGAWQNAEAGLRDAIESGESSRILSAVSNVIDRERARGSWDAPPAQSPSSIDPRLWALIWAARALAAKRGLPTRYPDARPTT